MIKFVKNLINVEFSVYIIIFVFILLITICFFISYIKFSQKCDFDLHIIINEYKKQSDYKEHLCMLIKLSINKVNGWNKITIYYTLLHYILNIWSIIFSCMSIYFSFDFKNKLSIFASIIAILAVSINLFLRCERKWSTSRKVLAKARIETNIFLVDLQSVHNTSKHIKKYANKIIELEKSLNDSELS